MGVTLEFNSLELFSYADDNVVVNHLLVSNLLSCFFLAQPHGYLHGQDDTKPVLEASEYQMSRPTPEGKPIPLLQQMLLWVPPCWQPSLLQSLCAIPEEELIPSPQQLPTELNPFELSSPHSWQLQLSSSFTILHHHLPNVISVLCL